MRALLVVVFIGGLVIAVAGGFYLLGNLLDSLIFDVTKEGEDVNF